ncbi:hypothetical protein HPB50_022981 [Hyalomma asiaticum]|uniref:Uncharacterized protein n=1 Tax=Hyalomma asiaticum TaxID=266040 RepID=A0ACB7RKY8_HYAAI|nr:hypothetical protein HPB50_022981 [Hyalomma asiaticum]
MAVNDADDDANKEEPREVPTTTETRNVLRLLRNKVECSGGYQRLMPYVEQLENAFLGPNANAKQASITQFFDPRLRLRIMHSLRNCSPKWGCPAKPLRVGCVKTTAFGSSGVCRGLPARREKRTWRRQVINVNGSPSADNLLSRVEKDRSDDDEDDARGRI